MQLSNEPGVQSEIHNLASQWKSIEKELNDLLNHEGYTLIKRKSKLLVKIKPNKSTLDEFISAVTNFRKGLCDWADGVRGGQRKNHIVVEICRKRKLERHSEIQSISFDIDMSRKRISSIESDIKRCNNDAISNDFDATQFERSAARSREMSNDCADIAAVGGGIGLLAGALFAPLTGKAIYEGCTKTVDNLLIGLKQKYF